MNIKKVIGLEHNYNGFEKYKLITCILIKYSLLGLNKSEIKTRLLYVSEQDKTNKIYILNGKKEIKKELSNKEYELVVGLTKEFQKSEEIK